MRTYPTAFPLTFGVPPGELGAPSAVVAVAVLVSIAVTPPAPSLDAATQQMVATGTYSDASTADITGSVTWSSGTPAKATVSAGGIVTPLKAGTSIITATLGAISGNTTATVNAPIWTLVSHGATNADNMALGTHAANDVIVVSTRRGNNAAPSVPAAAGSVPAWTTLQSGGADATAQTTVACLATAANHTTGIFTNATQIDYQVWRSNRGGITWGASSTGNGTASTSVIYPALTLLSATRSAGARFASRAATGGDAALLVPPTGWTAGDGSSSAAAPLQMSHSRLAVTSNPVADTVTGMALSLAYRCHTVEIREA